MELTEPVVEYLQRWRSSVAHQTATLIVELTEPVVEYLQRWRSSVAHQTATLRVELTVPAEYQTQRSLAKHQAAMLSLVAENEDKYDIRGY